MNITNIFDLPHFRTRGRFCESSSKLIGALPLFWACSGLDLCFTGSELNLLVESDFNSLEPWLAVELNGAPLLRTPLNRGQQEICLFRGMTPGVPKKIRVFKETQPIDTDLSHRLWIREVGHSDGKFLPIPEPTCRLEFIGDSLTSGEGVVGAMEETDWVPALFSASQTWAKQCADLLGADFRLISQSGWGVRSSWDNDPNHTLPGIYEQVCGPALGQANASMGAQEPYQFETWQPDAVIINLGTNDAGAMGNPPWHGANGQFFQQTLDESGRGLFGDAVVDFLKVLRRCNPAAQLLWVYGMIEGPLAPTLEKAITRFREETGDSRAYFLSLPSVTAETMGSRQHPGPACHRAAAERTAAFLKSVVP